MRSRRLEAIQLYIKRRVKCIYTCAKNSCTFRIEAVLIYLWFGWLYTIGSQCRYDAFRVRKIKNVHIDCENAEEFM